MENRTRGSAEGQALGAEQESSRTQEQAGAGADSHRLCSQASALRPVIAFALHRCAPRCTAGCRASPRQRSGGVRLLGFGCRVVGALGVQQCLGCARAALISIVVCQGASGHKTLTPFHSVSPVQAQQPVHMRLVQLGTARQDANLSPLPFPLTTSTLSQASPLPYLTCPLPTLPHLRMCSIQSRVRLVQRGTASQGCHPLPFPTPSLSFTHIPFPHFHTCTCAAFSGVCGWCSGGCVTGWRQYARRQGSWWEGGCHLIAVTTRCSWCSCLSQSCTQVRRGGRRGGAGCGGLGWGAALGAGSGE